MQNWNQWQLSTGAVTTTMPQPPVGYPTPGIDPVAMMQSYMQYYNQPAPNGYTAEQWAAAQQQSWAQWQQWQQQYQQWQAQYGEKYQETMKQLSAAGLNLPGQAPPLPPPLPKEDTVKPPLPPNTANALQFTNIPPPHQNNLPLFPAKQASGAAQSNMSNYSHHPPLPTSQPPLPPDNMQNQENVSIGKRANNTVCESTSAKKMKIEDEELSEAEKTFDAQFKQWEEQFNKWKQQNANHPDKTQYKQYEAKWTSWREKLIERREQMRRKREQHKQAAAKADAEKGKDLPAGDKILNILTSEENQGLINNLLGIGKTLGLTGMQESSAQSSLSAPPPPPPPPETAATNSHTTTGTSVSSATVQQEMSIHTTGTGPSTGMSNMTQASWAAQQWAAQYNAGMNMSNFPGFPSSSTMSPLNAMPALNTGLPPNQIVPPNFAQPPPTAQASVQPNFSQPPPGFPPSNFTSTFSANMRSSQGKAQDNSGLFGSNCNERSGLNANRFGQNDRFNQIGNFANDTTSPRGQSGPSSDYYGRDNQKREFIDQQGNVLRSNHLFEPSRGEYFNRNRDSLNDKSEFEQEHFRKDDGFNLTNDRFNPRGDGPGQENDRFVAGNNRFVQGNDHFNPGNDRFGAGNDRFGPGNERLGPGNDRFMPGKDRFGSNDRFGVGSDRFVANDRFGSGYDRFGPSSDRFGQENDRFGSRNDHIDPAGNRFRGGNDRFGRNNFDKMDADNRRDSFGNNSRGFNRNNQFQPPDELAPELKKLMEKRKAAMDVFKPSFNDSDKVSNVGSLSESFKKIAGDSPFASRNSSDVNSREYSGMRGVNNFGFRGPVNSGLAFNPDSFRPSGSDITLRGTEELKPGFPDFKPAGFELRDNLMCAKQDKDVENKSLADNSTRNATDNFCKDSGSNVSKDVQNNLVNENETSKKDTGDVVTKNDISFNLDGSMNLDKIIDRNLERTATPQQSTQQNANDSVPTNNADEDKSQGLNNADFKVGGDIKDEKKGNDTDNQGEIQALEKPPWIDESFSSGQTQDVHSLPSKNSAEEATAAAIAAAETSNTENTEVPSEEIKKSDSLPFMGENDPKPEDLNMEPPPELPNLGPVPQGLNNDQPIFGLGNPFGIRGIRPGGTAPFGPRGPVNDGKFPPFMPGELNGPNFNDPNFSPLRPVGMTFGPRGPRGPTDIQFGPRYQNDTQFGPRNPNDVQFSHRVPNDSHFGPRNMNDMQFGPRGSNDGSLGHGHGPNERSFVPDRSNDMMFGQFDSRGFPERPLRPRAPMERFGPRGPSSGPFGLRDLYNGPPGGPLRDFDVSLRNANAGHFGPPNESNKPFVQNHSDSLFGNKLPFDIRGPGDFRPRAPFNVGADHRSGIPSLMSINMGNAKGDGVLDTNVAVDRPDRPQSAQGMHPGVNQRSSCGPSETSPKNWKQPFSSKSFEDIDQNVGPVSDRHSFRPSESLNSKDASNFSLNKPNVSSDNSKQAACSDTEFRPGFGEPFTSTPMPYRRRPVDNRRSKNNEFHIERQFNYNHGGIAADKKFLEHIPVKVIDYAHVSRRAFQDYLMPAQCFDYGHGNLKPTVPVKEKCPQKDFRHWEESENNLKDYVEKMKVYESSVKKDCKYRRREINWSMEQDRHERRRTQKDYHKDQELDYEKKTRDRHVSEDHEDGFEIDRSNERDRAQDKTDKTQKDSNKENDKDEDRSKGNVNWQENSNKNVKETKHQDNSVSDTQQDAAETRPKTLELPKTQNCTMVDDLLCPPGRLNRPPKIAIILRGPPGSGKSFVAKLIKDKEVEQGGSAPRILSLDDYFLVEKERETKDDNGKKATIKEMVYEYEEAMEQSYITSLVKAFKKNITDGFFNFIILDCVNEKISDYEELWSFAKTKGFKVYVCEMEMDVQICLKRNIHNRSEEEINRIVDYFEPTPSHHQKLDVNSMLQEQAIEEVQMEDSQEAKEETSPANEDSQDSQEDAQDSVGISKWERMEAEDKLDRLDGLAKRKNEGKPQTMEDFLQVPDYYNMEDTTGKKRVRWADLEERKEQEKMRAVGFVVGHTNWDRMMDPTKGGSALTRTKYI